MVGPAPSAKYREMSQSLIRQAEEEFQKGDLIQASEKAWGAAACATKSIAAQRGWNHYSHDILYDISSQIADEQNRPDLSRVFRSASSLHTNFYENWMAESHVEGGIDDARTYIQEVEAIRSAPPPNFVPQTSAQAVRLRRLTR